MTEVIKKSSRLQLNFSRPRRGQFHSRAGVERWRWLLLRQADRKIGLLDRVASCFNRPGLAGVCAAPAFGDGWPSASYGLAWAMRTSTIHEQLATILDGVMAGRRKLEAPWRARAR